MSEARDHILASIRTGLGTKRAAPAYTFPAFSEDAVSRFITKARASVAEVDLIGSTDEAPAAILAILAKANARPRLHIPVGSALRDLPWGRTPGLTIEMGPPTGEDAALSAADYAIAETGTLVFFSGALKPSSWHFRPGREIVLVRRGAILRQFEDVIALLRTMPATLNLITGPSRTADIEQTIELGAHGPRHLNILLAG